MRKRRPKWTSKEDALLRRLRQELPNAGWDEIATHFAGRNSNSIERRWRRIRKHSDNSQDNVQMQIVEKADETECEPMSIGRRFPWLKAEDHALLAASAVFASDWDAISAWVREEAPHPDGHIRGPKACQSRLAKLQSAAPAESSGIRWTDDDIELIRKHYPAYGPDLALLLAGRSREAVGNIAFREGVICRDRSRSPKKGMYRREEVALMEDFYERPLRDLASVMRRAVESVRSKMASLNLPATDNGREVVITEDAENHTDDTRTVESHGVFARFARWLYVKTHGEAAVL